MLKRLRAFTLLEVVATLAVIAILAGATVPSIVGYLTRKGVEQTATILADLSTGVNAMFASSVGWYPFRIAHLASPIGANDTTSCSGIGVATPVNVYGVNTWPGPFFHHTIPSTGLPTPIGTIIDTIYRSGAKGTSSILPLTIRNVRLEDAEDLNTFVDGDANNGDGSNTLGKVQFTVPVNGLVDVSYIAVAATGKNNC